MSHRLLLADDSVTIQRVIELTFADEDVDVIAVGDGAQAIEKITAEPPDIILVDTCMPERDGYEVAEFVKSDDSRRHIPVVLLTGAFEPVDKARAEGIGCDAVLVKPFEPQQVVAKVRELLTAPAAARSGAVREATVGVAPRRKSALETADIVIAASAVKTTLPPRAIHALPRDVGDDELTHYLDQLDEAFAGLDEVTPAAAAAPAFPEPPGEAPAEAITPAPPLSEAPAEAEAADISSDGGEWDHPFAGKPAQTEVETSPPSVEPSVEPSRVAATPDASEPTPAPSTTIPPVSPAPLAPPPMIAVPSVEPAEPAEQAAPQAPVPAPAVEAAPPVSAVSLSPAPADGHTVLAEAFSTFLVAEQGTPLPAAPTEMPVAESRGLALTDQVVEEMVIRVVERLTDRILRETTAEIVSRVAEQLVREEIDRIKSLN